MDVRLHGRVLVAGEGAGVALRLEEPLSLWGGLNPQTGEIIDRRHPQSGAIVTGRILVMPSGRGSSSASSILLESVRLATAPAAILLRSETDGIITLGAVVAQELYHRAPPVLLLDEATYAQITDGASLRVFSDGQIKIGYHAAPIL